MAPPARPRAMRPGTAPRGALAAVAALLIASLSGAPARAQSAKDKADSDKLYQDGLSKMLQGALDVGCPKLAESQRLFPRPGTLFTLAECEAKAGRVASAVEHYKEYLKLFAEMDPEQQAKQREKQRDKISQSQIDALSANAPRLTITVEGRSEGLTVKLDGAPMSSDRFGAATLVDPGDHVVTWEGGEGGPGERRVSLALGGSESIAVKGVPEKKGPAPVAPAEPTGPSGRRIAAYVAGGVGAAALVGGAVTGGLAAGKKGVVSDHCKDTGQNDVWSCDAEGKAAADSGKSLATISSVMFGVGGAALAAGVILFLTEPKAKTTEGATRPWISPEVAIGPSGGFVGASGVW